MTGQLVVVLAALLTLGEGHQGLVRPLSTCCSLSMALCWP